MYPRRGREMRGKDWSMSYNVRDGERVPGDLTDVWLAAMWQTLSPDIQEIAILCAIPAWVDLRLLVLLSGKSPELCAEWLTYLLLSGLLQMAEGGGYIYPPKIRERLLAQWYMPGREQQYAALVLKLAEHYLELLFEQVVRLAGPEREAALERLDRYYPNVEALWEASVVLNYCDLACSFVSLLDGYHTHRDLWTYKVRWLRETLDLCGGHLADTERARMLNSLGVAYMQVSTQPPLQNVHKAIACYEEALKLYNPKTEPLDYAMVHNNLGNVYLLGLTGDRASDLKKAIGYYTAALRFCSPDIDAASYGIVQANLGFAYAELPSGNRHRNLHRAIKCYTAALEVYTPETSLSGYAKLQLGLGAAYADLSLEENLAPRPDLQQANLRAVIAHYTQALRFYTLETFPWEYAQIHMDLAQAYTLLSADDKEKNLKQAIACYKAVLCVYTLAQAPLLYAEVQVALGLIYSQFSDQQMCKQSYFQALYSAIECYECALEVYEPESAPLEYAQIMVYLGLAYTQLATDEQALDLEQSLLLYQVALGLFDVDLASPIRGYMYGYLGNVYTQLSKLDTGIYLSKAIACYEIALGIYTPEVTPLIYAHLQNKLGLLYAQLQSEEWEANLRKAILCFKRALHLWRKNDETSHLSAVRKNLKSTYAVLACLYVSQGDIQRLDELYQEAHDQYLDGQDVFRFWAALEDEKRFSLALVPQ